jgi:uncharacterized protein YcfJ
VKAKFPMALLAAMGLASAAWANGPAADACAAKLTPDGKTIYAAIMAAKPTKDNLRSVAEHQTRSLAMGGKISRGNARDNATAAGECIKLGWE